MKLLPGDGERVRRAIRYAEATYHYEAPDVEASGGLFTGMEAIEVEHALHLVDEFDAGRASDVQEAYLAWLTEYWTEEEEECLKLGIDRRRAMAGIS